MRDILQNFPTEMVSICDSDGNEMTHVKGLFGKTHLTITDTSIPILEDYIVLRTLPNGYIEKYKITESKYVKGHGDICDFYELYLIKQNKIADVQKANIYNDYSVHIGDNNNIEKSIIGDNNEN